MANKKPRKTTVAEREMAALMFTDVRGYSSLAQQDESLALRLLELKRRLADPLIDKHGGRLIKTMGDALMVEFRSALAAVRCATELQDALAKHNRSRPVRERLVLRIGVHLGDVVRRDGDLLGDTVNIAARVEPEAPPGGVALTKAVYDQIQGKFDRPLITLGQFKLKGIANEMPLYAVDLPGMVQPAPKAALGLVARLKRHHMFRIASWYATAAYVLILVSNAVFPDIGLTRGDVRYLIAGLALGFPVVLTLSWMFVPPSREDPATFGRWKRLRFRLGAAMSLLVIAFVVVSGTYLWRLNVQQSLLLPAVPNEGVRLIAVMPLAHEGVTTGELAAGIRDEVEGALSNISSVRLVADEALPGSGASPDALANIRKASGAGFVLEGSVSQALHGADIAVSMKLISVDSAETLYEDREDYAAAAPVQDIQAQEAADIAGPVRLLTGDDPWLATGHPTTDNPRAMELLRQAMVSMRYQLRDPKRTELLRSAIALDPGFAQAHAYLAFNEAGDPEPGLVDARALVSAEIAKAEALAPGLPEAGLARAAEQAWMEGDWSGALKTVEGVSGQLAHNTFLHIVAGSALHELGRYREALGEFNQAAELDPYQFWQAANIPLLQYQLHDYEGAQRTLQEYLRTWPLNRALHRWQAVVGFAQHGDTQALNAALAPDRWVAFGVAPDDPLMEGMRLEALHFAGRHAELIERLKRYPDACLVRSGYPALSLEEPCVAWLTAESLRLLGQDKEAVEVASLARPKAQQELKANPEDDFLILHLALLQVFGGETKEALATISPILARLENPVSQWSEYDAESAQSVAGVLAWGGQKAEAVAVLSKALDAPFGAHAAIVAHDPVWKPLYDVPAFKALLASYGQTLAYAK